MEQSARSVSLRIDAERRNRLLDELQLVGGIEDVEVGIDPKRLTVAAKHASTDRVKRTKREAVRLVAEQRLHALPHLPRRFVGECDGEHLPRSNVALEQVGDAVRDHARLSAPRPRQYKQRTTRNHDCVSLRGAEPLEKSLWLAAGRVVRGRKRLSHRCRGLGVA